MGGSGKKKIYISIDHSHGCHVQATPVITFVEITMYGQALDIVISMNYMVYMQTWPVRQSQAGLVEYLEP